METETENEKQSELHSELHSNMQNKQNERQKFSIGEICIVVVILGIMSAVVVPQFSRASNQARLSELMGDLQTMRAQLELYKIQHNNRLPGQNVQAGPINPQRFIEDLTTHKDGMGPYLKKIPKNVFNGMGTIMFVNNARAIPLPSSGTGWWLNSATGEFRANDSKMNINY